MKERILIFALACLLRPVAAFAALMLAQPFQDGMVLQRDKPITVYGYGATPGVQIEVVITEADNVTRLRDVVLEGSKVTGSAWSVTLPSLPVSTKPRSIIVLHPNIAAVCQNVLIGDVWLCGGQSNMRVPALNVHIDATKDLPDTIRLCGYKATGYVSESVGFASSSCKWVNSATAAVSTEESQMLFGAPYYFAMEVRKSLKEKTGEDVPIGLVDIAISGTPLAYFVPFEYAQADSELAIYLQETINIMVREGQPRIPIGNCWAVYTAQLGGIAISGCLWCQGGTDGLHNRGIEGYALRKGDACVDLTRRAYLSIAKGVRAKFGEKTPFYLTQIQSYPFYAAFNFPTPYAGLSALREAQRLAGLQIPKPSGMASIADITGPDGLHPHKPEMGRRLAALALRDVYGFDVTAEGPRPVQATVAADGTVTVSFESEGKGIVAGSIPPIPVFDTATEQAEGTAIHGFWLSPDNADEHWYEAEARIENGRIVCKTALCPDPKFVRYAYEESPCGFYTASTMDKGFQFRPAANLYGKTESGLLLPAAVFKQLEVSGVTPDPEPKPAITHSFTHITYRAGVKTREQVPGTLSEDGKGNVHIGVYPRAGERYALGVDGEAVTEWKEGGADGAPIELIAPKLAEGSYEVLVEYK